MASTRNMTLEDILNELTGQPQGTPIDNDGTGEDGVEWVAPIVSHEERIATLELKVAQLATILQHITGNEIP